MWLILLLCIPFAIWAVWYTEHSKKVADSKECFEGEEKHNADVSLIASHICGLPLGEKSECKLFLASEKIIIESQSSIFKLDKNKILDVSLKTSKEVQNSISGAVGGAMLLGAIGAFIGGSDTKLRMFLIFIYDSNEEKKCISFEVENIGDRCTKARKFVEDFKNSVTEKKEIEL
jgi:hypothetical protein|nr:MAG TPA: hypothetical protein [Caudoviricetes sp.]